MTPRLGLLNTTALIKPEALELELELELEPKRHPGDTQEAPRMHPGDTQEAPRRHPGDTQRHQGLQRSFWRSWTQKLMPLSARITFFIENHQKALSF